MLSAPSSVTVATGAAQAKRGRPKGAVTNDFRRIALGVCHFAFLRAWINGVDLHQAWDRYLAYEGSSSDERHIKAVRERLYSQVVSDGHALNAQLGDEHKIDRFLAVLDTCPQPTAVMVLPTIESFCQDQGLDQDFYSEAEIQQLMCEHYHLDQVEEGQDDERTSLEWPVPELNAHVQALNALQVYLARAVGPQDGLDLWFAPGMVLKLQSVGVVTVGDLVDYVNVHGYRWYRRIATLGPTRARRIVQWLLSFDQPDDDWLRLRPTSLGPSATAFGAGQIRVGGQVIEPEPVPRFGLVPMERLVVPEQLSGRHGYLRASGPNTLGAESDAQAVQAWLSTYADRPKTWDAYKREIERVWLWALLVARKSLSSLTSQDAAQYKAFLAAPTADWIQPRPVPRNSEAWRPFRRPLDCASQVQALRVASICFDALVSHGYLVANPMTRSLHKDTKARNQRSMTQRRGFTASQWAWIWRCTREVSEAGMRRQRIRLLLRLLVSTGLRLDELTRARRGDLVCVELDPLDPVDPLNASTATELAWLLPVVGKGGVEREVPVPQELIGLIDEHLIACLNHLSSDPVVDLSGQDFAGLPLVAQIMPAVGAAVGRSSTSGCRLEPLRRSGVYRTLKRYFQFVERQALAEGRADAKQLASASTHWLRHTFGRMAVADGVPLDVVKEAMGHASLATTSIYTTAERTRVVRELRRLNVSCA